MGSGISNWTRIATPLGALLLLAGCPGQDDDGWLPKGSIGQSSGADSDDPPADDDDPPADDDDDEPPADDGDPPADDDNASASQSDSSTGPDTTVDPTATDPTGATTTSGDEGSESSTGEPVDPPPFDPLYRIDVRIHRGNSGLTDEELLGYLTEMNLIWRDQAAICFEFEVVDHDDTMSTGYDMWFQPEVGGPNGYYAGDHDIWVRDYPSLGNAPNPVMYGGARTAAHELGHGLTLDHDQSSDDYLMRSGTEGFEIPEYQITASRQRAAQKALEDAGPLNCATPTI